jgi:integrase
MARTLNRLTAMKVQRAKAPGMYADGGSLYLRIAPGGSKQWVFRYARRGRLRDLGLGPVHTLALAEAREKARDARKLLLEGIDPIDAKHARMAALQAADARAMTFAQCAEGFIRDNERKWTNATHRQQWTMTLTSYAYPVLGALPVQAIDTPLVLKVVKPLWERAPVTAKRLLGRIENVLGWATVHHYRTGDNPARWRGHIEHALPKVERAANGHHVALPYPAAPAFMAKFRPDTSVASSALRFITLTASRLGEAINATWDEIDLTAKVWTVPASRMKAGVEHRVPLSDGAVAVLESMRAVRQSAYVFPGRIAGKSIGNHSVWRLAKAASGDKALTVHGLRSSFRDWAAECTNFPREVAEMALAHAIPNAVEAAYRRGDLFEKRRRLMEAWAQFCGKPATGSKVVAIRE